MRRGGAREVLINLLLLNEFSSKGRENFFSLDWGVGGLDWILDAIGAAGGVLVMWDRRVV